MKRFEALTHGFLRVRFRRGGHGVHDEIDPVLVIQLPHIPVTDQVLADSYERLRPDRDRAWRRTATKLPGSGWMVKLPGEPSEGQTRIREWGGRAIRKTVNAPLKS